MTKWYFRIHFFAKKDEFMMIVGNIPELGNWILEKAPKMFLNQVFSLFSFNFFILFM